MFILKIILWILAVLLILIFSIFILLIVCKTGIHLICDKNKNIKLWLKLGFLNIKLYPLKKTNIKDNQQSKEQNKDKEENEDSDKQEKNSKFSFSDLDFEFCTQLIFDLIHDLTGKIYIDKLYFTLILASDDCAKTGIMLGGAFSLSGMFLPVLEQSFCIKEKSITIDADFDSDKIKFDLDFIMHTRLIQLLFVLFHHRKRLLRLYDSIK